MLEEAVSDADKEILDREMVVNILTNIRNQVNEFAFDQVFEILEDVKKYSLSEDDRKLFHELESLMDELAVDDIRQLIEEALQEGN